MLHVTLSRREHARAVVVAAIALLQVLEDEKVPMDKVFISVSGGEMRSSNLTAKDGTVIYSDVVGVVRRGHVYYCWIFFFPCVCFFVCLFVCL